MASLAVVLIACPCALGLATPMAVWAALGRAARHQVLFRDGDALARLAGVRAVMFDKTGTLSSDALSVASVVVTSGESPERVIAAAAALSAGSTHPLSRAVSQFATLTLRETWFRRAESVSTVAGRGLNAELAELSTTAYLGSVRYMEELDLAIDAVLQQRLDAARCEGRSVVCVGWRGRVRGYFLLEESLRPRAAETIAWLGAHGIRTGILSGDHESRCQRLCEQIGHAGVAIHAELLPDEKLALIHRTRHEVGTVAMVGDGINDAPALAAADIGIALGCGADVSRESADVCLLSNDLSRLPWAIWLAQRTVRAIRWNLFWALSYNIAGVALAAAGFLNPIVAAIAMTASSLLVISNSLRLGREAENAFGESATAIAIANQPRTDDSAEKLARTTSRD